MTLREARCLFTVLLAELILEAKGLGYEVAFDEVTQHQKKGHREGSLHYIGLAGDLNLYRNGRYLTKTEDHRELGQRWKGKHKFCAWGGDFKSNPDGNHYSFAPPEIVGNRK